MTEKKQINVGDKIILERKDDGWFVYVEQPGKGATGLTASHDDLDEAVKYLKQNFSPL